MSALPMLSPFAVASLARALRSGALWRRWTLGRALHERIALRVSAANGCAVCYGIHLRAAERRLPAACTLEPLGDLPPADRAALRFASARTRRAPDEPERARELEAFF